jgi:hypothetical protein
MILGTFSAMLMMPETTPVRIPLYLYYLVFLVVGHYFAARRHQDAAAPQEAPPLHLPRGTFRFLILVGLTAVVVWGFYHDPHFADRLTPSPGDQPYLFLAVLGAFFLGVVVNRVGSRLLGGPAGVPPWFQDIQAWIALLATLGMTIEVIIRLVINPTLTERQLVLHEFEAIVAALVAFYFGARS